MKVWKGQLNTRCADRGRLASDQQRPGCQSPKWIGRQSSSVIGTSLSRPHEGQLLSPQNLTFYQCFALLVPNWPSIVLAILKKINRNQSLGGGPLGLAAGPRFTRSEISQCLSMFWSGIVLEPHPHGPHPYTAIHQIGDCSISLNVLVRFHAGTHPPGPRLYAAIHQTPDLSMFLNVLALRSPLKVFPPLAAPRAYIADGLTLARPCITSKP